MASTGHSSLNGIIALSNVVVKSTTSNNSSKIHCDGYLSLTTSTKASSPRLNAFVRFWVNDGDTIPTQGLYFLRGKFTSPTPNMIDDYDIDILAHTVSSI
jgi:hypothetical protein